MRIFIQNMPKTYAHKIARTRKNRAQTVFVATKIILVAAPASDACAPVKSSQVNKSTDFNRSSQGSSTNHWRLINLKSTCKENIRATSKLSLRTAQNCTDPKFQIIVVIVAVVFPLLFLFFVFLLQSLKFYIWDSTLLISHRFNFHLFQ